MKHTRIRELFVAVILALGMLFISTNTAFAEENEPETLVESTPNEGGETPVLGAPAGDAGNPALLADSGSGENEEMIPETPVTAEEVQEAISDAQFDETIAGGTAVFADSETSIEIIADETLAALDGEDAKEAVDTAEQMLHEPDTSETVIDASETIHDYSDAVADAADATSDEIMEESSENVAEAKEAYHDAEQAEYVEDAQAAADRAKAAYEDAKTKADAAETAYTNAQAKYDDAQTAYQAAKAEYDAALADAKAYAEAHGYENLEEAMNYASDALIAAINYKTEAEEELEDAEAELEQAKTHLEDDWAGLKEAIDVLADKIVDNTSEVIHNVGETTITGIGYSIAEIIAGYYDVQVEYKKGQIQDLQEDIEASKKQLAVELLRRLKEEDLSPEQIADIQNKLVELVIWNIHINDVDPVDLKYFDPVDNIDGISISDNLPEGHKKGDDNYYLRASDDEGNAYYYEVRLEERNLELFPIIFTNEQLVDEAIPTKEAILEDAPSLGGYKAKVLNDIYVTKDGETAKYEVIAVQYNVVKEWKWRTEQKLILRNEDKTLGDLLKALAAGFLRNDFSGLSDIGEITDSLDKDKYHVYHYSFNINDKDPILVENAVDGYKLLPVLDDAVKPLDTLIEEYETHVTDQEAAIAELEMELYGDDLNHFIQKNLDTFVVNNLDKIVSMLRSSNENETETPDFWETIQASVGNIDLTDINMSNGLFDGIGNLFNDVSASIMNGIMNYSGKLIGSALPSAEGLGDLLSWDFTGIEWGSLNIFSLLGNPTLQKLTTVILSLQEGGLNEESMAAVNELLQVRVPLKTKKAIADVIELIMAHLHHDAYEELKQSITDGKEEIDDAWSDVGGYLSDLRYGIADYLKAQAGLAQATVKDAYADLLVLNTFNAWYSAYEATQAMRSYIDSMYAPKLAELEDELADANFALAEAADRYSQLKKNAFKAKRYWKKAEAIVPTIEEYDVWVSGKQITNKNKKDVFGDGTVSYSSSKKTLALKNADIKVSEVDSRSIYAGIYSGDALTIIVKGANRIIASEYETSPFNIAGIYTFNDLTIVGSKKHPVLDIDLNGNNGSETYLSSGIFCLGNLKIKDVTLNAVGDEAMGETVFYGASIGIASAGTTTIDHSNVFAQGGDSLYSYGIWADQIHLEDSSVLNSRGGYGVKESGGMNANRIYVKDSNVTSKAGNTKHGLSAGIYLEYDSSDDNELYSQQNAGFLAAPAQNDAEDPDYYLEISGNSSVTAVGGNHAYESYGIYSNNNASKILVKENGSLEVIGGKSCYLSTGIQITELEVSNEGTVVARSGKKDNVRGYGIVANRLILNDTAEVTAKSWSTQTDDDESISCAVYAVDPEGIVLNDSSILNAESRRTARDSYGIMGDVLVNDSAQVTAIACDADHDSYGILGDLTVYGDGETPAVITVKSGVADEISCGIDGDVYAQGNFGITVTSGSGRRKSGEVFGIDANTVILKGEKNSGSYLNVDSGKAKETSYGIVADKGITVRDATLEVHSGNAGHESIAVKADITASAKKDSKFDITARSGDADYTYGIFGNITAKGADSERISYITVYSGDGIETIGITKETEDGERSNIELKNVFLQAYSGTGKPGSADVRSYGILGNNLSAVNSIIIGRAGDIDLTGVTLDEEETLEAISAGIYITGLPLAENTVLELKNSDAIGSSGSINYGEYGNSPFVVFKTYGIYADVIKANNSTVSGKTEAYLLSERGENAVADAYGIYAKQIDAKKGSEIFGGRQSSETDAIQEPIESSKQFSNSNGIYVGELNVSKSTVNGFGEQADFSAGIELGKTLNAKKSVIRGTGAENSYNSYGIFTSDAHLVLDKESSFYGKGGDQSLISGGILLGNASLVEVKNSSIVCVGGDNVNVSYGISGYNTSLHVEDSEMTAHAGIASMNSYGVSLRADSELIIEGKSNVFADTGDRESMEPSGKASYAIYMERLGEDEAGMIMVSGDSSLVAVSSGAEEESVAIYIDGSIFLYDTSLLISICNTEAGTGIGLENGNLYAMDHSEIVIAGSKQAFGNHVGQYLFDNRGVRISENCKGEPYTYWNKYDDLRTESVKYVEIDDDEQQNYVMTSGDVIWKKDSTDGAVFVFKNSDETTVNITYPHFTGVQVDGERLDPSKYTAIPGSVIVTLKPAYLNTLEEGIHFLTVMFNNGNNVSSQFRIAKADPKPTPEPGKKGSGGTSTSNTSSVVTCQMAGYPNGYAWNEAAKACQPGYIDANGVFHSYKTSGRYNTPNTADEGINPLYLLLLSMMSAGALGYVFGKES